MQSDLIVVDDVPGEFARRMEEAFVSRPGRLFSLAMSGGDTARECYERLASDASRVDWGMVDV
ncbi:MAG: hypothetical protein ACRD1G_12560, partial [Acidimicrobiales bacterium]